jgi:hypothetical protein
MQFRTRTKGLQLTYLQSHNPFNIFHILLTTTLASMLVSYHASTCVDLKISHLNVYEYLPIEQYVTLLRTVGFIRTYFMYSKPFTVSNPTLVLRTYIISKYVQR